MSEMEMPKEQSPGDEVSSKDKKTIREYYHKVNDCRVVISSDPHCVCWHAEGTGPFPEALPEHSLNQLRLVWRIRQC